jgi:hypothetical protein
MAAAIPTQAAVMQAAPAQFVQAAPVQFVQAAPVQTVAMPTQTVQLSMPSVPQLSMPVAQMPSVASAPTFTLSVRPAAAPQQSLSTADIEDVLRAVQERKQKAASPAQAPAAPQDCCEELRTRVDNLEARVSRNEDEINFQGRVVSDILRKHPDLLEKYRNELK